MFASLVDDPASRPDEFPTEEDQEVERKRLFGIIDELVRWENSNDERVLAQAQEEILRSNDGNPPTILDPFCGGGSIPLEAQRLGLEVRASDLNPVAVLITKALIEIPARFAARSPVNPEARERLTSGGTWRGAQGLAEDIGYYGRWMRDEAERRIGHLYPKARLPKGGEATVAAYIWARTVRCPNPACGAGMPLVRSFALSTKRGKGAWILPIVDRVAKTVSFEVRTGKDGPPEPPKVGRGAKFRCLVCDQVADDDYIKSEGMARRMSAALIAIAAEDGRGRIYLPPDATTGPDLSTEETKRVRALREGALAGETPKRLTGGTCYGYGLTTWGSLFTDRQLVALGVFADLVSEAREQALKDAIAAGLANDGLGIANGGTGAGAYSDAVATYLGLALSRVTEFCNTICSWDAGNTNLRQLFARQAIPMTWDYAETNLLQGVVSFEDSVRWGISALSGISTHIPEGTATQLDAASSVGSHAGVLVFTDPPYYDNIGYSDLSDFFYVWLRPTLGSVYPDLFSTLLTPKTSELVASPYRFDGSRDRAREFFENGLGEAFKRMREVQTPEFPMLVYYAFKQSDASASVGAVASTGWETMLEALLAAGFMVTGTWPLRTEQQQRSVAAGTNALASSIVLTCRPRPADAPVATLGEFTKVLRGDLPGALRVLQQGNIAPVDLAQAAIGPGMAVFSRYAKVVEASGERMSVRTALGLINQVLDEVLTEQESDFDGATRFAIAWFETHGLAKGPYGEAQVLAQAKGTTPEAIDREGFLDAKGGKVQLLHWSDLPVGWDPTTDKRLTYWEATHYLIRAHQDEDSGSEQAAAQLLRRMPGYGETARELAYRLYVTCERKGWADLALSYNALVVAWPEITRLADAQTLEQAEQTTFGG